MKGELWKKRYYIDGKCILSYDDDVFSTDEAGMNAWREELDFLGPGDGMIEHIWCEHGIDKRRFPV
ncbi:hypothetical protein [Eshraghiella crossota]|uniref:hypothetical protein n=1 Tax=Eshraghiella crossota TaxID=45851 RepID=UPI003AB195FB